jgi:hypothetical protein
VSDLPDDQPGAPWHQRLLRRTSLPTQLLHSGTSFLMMAGMARLAPTDAFALATAFFLLVTLTSSLNVYVLSAAWLRNGEDEDLQSLAVFTLLTTLGLSVTLTVVWAVYRHWAFGAAPEGEPVLVLLASFSYLFCLAWRRQLLLDARFSLATLGDGLRALVTFAGAWALSWFGLGYAFEWFLLAFIASHFAAVAPVMHEVLGHAVPRRDPAGWLQRGLRPLAAMTRGDWLGVCSGLANVVFSQAASLLAPMLIGAGQFATLRAYELFLFPVIFMAQLLDPLYMRRYRDASQGGAAMRLSDVALPAALMFAPLCLLLLAGVLVPPLQALLLALIAPEYRSDFWLMSLVLALSGWISLNAPIRWRLTVAGAGSTLLKGTVVGIVCSLLVLWLLTRSQPLAWSVLAAKMAYEACLCFAGVVGMARLSGMARR